MWISNRQAASSTIHFNTISSATAAVTYTLRSFWHFGMCSVFCLLFDSNISYTIQKIEMRSTFYDLLWTSEKKFNRCFLPSPKNICMNSVFSFCWQPQQRQSAKGGTKMKWRIKLKVTIESMKEISVWATTATALTFDNGKKRPQRAADAKLFYFGLFLQHILSVNNSSVGWFKIVRL